MDEEELLDKALRSVAGTSISTITRRSMGNAAHIPIAIGTEMLNKEYGQELRSNKPYDAFDHSLVFSGLSTEDLKKNSVPENFMKVIAGPFGPLLQTSTRAGILASRAFAEKSREETKKRAIDELTTRMAFEAVGQTGLIPLYKDIRRIVINDMFSDIDKPKQKAPQITKKQIEEMKKIDPKLAREMEQIYNLNK